MQVGDLVKDNLNGMLGIVMVLDDSSGIFDGVKEPDKAWIGFKYLEHLDGMIFWQPASKMSVISSI